MRDSLTGKEISVVRRHGKRFQNRHFSLYVIPGKKDGLAVVVSGKVGISVVRNRIKRRVRQAYRLALKRNCNILRSQQSVIYPKFSVSTANFNDLGHSIETTLVSALKTVERSD